jgi:DNA-directed RNA polymerase I subunit RPA2
MAIAYDPLAPTTASSSTDKSTFHTLKRERAFRHPPADKSDVPALDELVRPHLDSFNALVEDGPDGTGKGLLQLGVEDIDPKCIFDGQQEQGFPFGTKIACTL